MSKIVPITPWAAEVEKRGNVLTTPSVAEAEIIVTIDSEMISIGDDSGAGLVC